MSKDRVSVHNLLWGCPTWFLADFFCPTCPTHLSHQSVPRLFPNWVDRTELNGRDGRFIWTAWNKRTRKIEKTQVTPPHNPEVGGSSPPPATNKPLKSHDFSGFLHFPLLFCLVYSCTCCLTHTPTHTGNFSGKGWSISERIRDCRRVRSPSSVPLVSERRWSHGRRCLG